MVRVWAHFHVGELVSLRLAAGSMLHGGTKSGLKLVRNWSPPWYTWVFNTATLLLLLLLLSGEVCELHWSGSSHIGVEPGAHGRETQAHVATGGGPG